MMQTPDKGARLWLIKYSQKNYWRVASWMDLDDLIQDGYESYYETLRRYPNAKDNAHIMSLFKLVFRSCIEDLVRNKSRQLDDAASDYLEQCDERFEGVVASADTSMFNTLLAQAPKQIKEALVLLSTDEGRKALAAPYKVAANGVRETMNQRLCRLLGYDASQIDLTTMLREHFTIA